MKIGFTGTQEGMSARQRNTLRALLISLSPEEFHHGDCIGADLEADTIANQFVGCPIIVHPPTDPKKRAFTTRLGGRIVREQLPYLDRNHAIVDETDYLIAAPKANREELRSGTWATIRYARKMGRQIKILER